jgi:nucleoside-diphosphate-sugar epimerase
MTPVDWVAEAVLRISTRADSIGRAFHLVDPTQKTTMNQVASFVASFGFPLRTALPYREWKGELYRATSTSTENALTPLRHYFAGGFPRGMLPASTVNLARALSQSDGR